MSFWHWLGVWVLLTLGLLGIAAAIWLLVEWIAWRRDSGGKNGL
jgi:hypothetical protein